MNKIGVVAAIIVIFVLMPVTVSTRTRYSCTLCRAERIERTFLGLAWRRYRDTEFTPWYEAHRPAHAHQWGRLSCTRGFTLLGVTTLYACGAIHPVCHVPPDTLKEFAEGADTNTVTAFFDGIMSTDTKTQDHAVQMVWDWYLERYSAPRTVSGSQAARASDGEP